MPITSSYKVRVFAAATLGAVMPRFSFHLVVSTSLAELQRAIGGAIAERAVLVKMASFFQSVFHSVESIHLLGVILRAQTGSVVL
jgi:hypothetical protein